MGRALGSLLLALALVTLAPAAAMMQQPPAPSAGRLTIVLGDLHMGVGRDASGAWDAREDFRWAQDLAAFLKVIDAQGRGATDLVFDGDTFELLQDVKDGCRYDDPALGCTESDALARFERVLAAHGPEMAALGAFARSGSNRVVFVPGDHDAALLFSAVAQRLMKTMAAPRAEVATPGYWASTDGRIYVEHGHQLDFSAARFDSWPKPFVTRAGRTHLMRPWGEQLVQPLYDRHELAYPIVDNVAEEGAGIKFALAAEGIADAGADAPQLLRFFLSKMSWPQFRLDLDGGNAPSPTWDLVKVRGTGPDFLLASLPGDDRFKALAAKAHETGRVASLMNGLTDDEIVAICDYRAAIRRARRRLERSVTQLPGQGPAVTECPRTADTQGSAFEYFWRSRDGMITRRLAVVQPQLPKSGHPIEAFVFGHTHLPNTMRGQPGTIEKLSPGEVFVLFGFNPVRTSVTPVALNAGAWQRTVTPNQLDDLRKDHGLSEQALLRSVRPEDLAPCYSFVEIAPSQGPPAPRTLYWRQSEKAAWEIATGCGRPPTVPAPARGQLRPLPGVMANAPPELLDRVRADPFTYFRFINRAWAARVCEVFSGVQGLPHVRLHGDAHVEQFAFTSESWGLTDFDDSARGPAFIDIVRFLGSIDLATRERGWTSDRDGLWDRFFAGYRAGLSDPTLRPPVPDIVRVLRRDVPPTREAFLAWGEGQMQPMAEATSKSVVAGMAAFERFIRPGRPDLPAGYFAVKTAGWLRIGVGSAATKKVLVRIQGPTADDADDQLLEAKEVSSLDGVSCLEDPSTSPALRIIDGTRQLGRMKHDILAVGPSQLIPAATDSPEHSLNWWVSSWEPSYREVHLSDLRSVGDLTEIVYDSGFQLGVGDPSDASARTQMRSSVDALEGRFRKETPAIVEELIAGWRELSGR